MGGKAQKPKNTISNVALGFMGAILDAAKANKSKIINIPHGTLSPSYNKYDKIYKNILPPLRLLNPNEEKDLIKNLKDLNFTLKSLKAA